MRNDKMLTKVGKCGITCRRYRQGKANGSLLIVVYETGS
jgi:hypothetical protein